MCRARSLVPRAALPTRRDRSDSTLTTAVNRSASSPSSLPSPPTYETVTKFFVIAIKREIRTNRYDNKLLLNPIIRFAILAYYQLMHILLSRKVNATPQERNTPRKVPINEPLITSINTSTFVNARRQSFTGIARWT